MVVPQPRSTSGSHFHARGGERGSVRSGRLEDANPLCRGSVSVAVYGCGITWDWHDHSCR